MRISKVVFALLAVAVVVLFAGQTVVYGGGGVPNPWAVNSAARGIKADGPLTIYGDRVLPTSPTNPDETILMHFFLRVQSGGTQHIFTGVSSTTLLHPLEIGGQEAVALHQFLKDVLVALTGGADSDYATCIPDPFGDGLPNPCPNILKSMDNVVDTEGEGGALLSLIADVQLMIPR